QEHGEYLDITCQDATGHQAFDLIGGELAERLANNVETAAEIVTRVIAKWRRFWGQASKQLLTRERQIGLFAEVWFLTYWLIPRFGAAGSVGRWRGPFGSRHDFESNDFSVEVKATTATRGCIHRINGIDQLTPPDNSPLFCFSLQLREEAGAANSLPSVVSACHARLTGDPNAIGMFESALSRAVYSSIYEDEYIKLKLRVVTQGLYTVRDDFPRLTRAEFPNGLPSGIEYVEYDINLDGVPHLCVARQPAEANVL
ncbi:MAG: PD-(D/E)XK motif protein, partial [Burkholderiales bacterium]|nr:PD-(D/E)XK motif protein [Burkholderiales bacterium]